MKVGTGIKGLWYKRMPLLLAIAVLSAAAIGYEILLMRLFSIVQWYHFASMVISLALLGYGASGTFLALTRTWALRHFTLLFMAGAALFGITSVGAFALGQRLTFNPLELTWDWRQWGYLFALYLILAIPFFCAGTSLGLAYARFTERIGALYGADLCGAGAGAVLVVLLLFGLFPERALTLIAAGGLAAAALAALGGGRPYRPAAIALVLVAGASPLVWPLEAVKPMPSPYKPLSQVLHMPGTEIVATRSSPLGLLTVVESPTIPFRHAPGLSMISAVDIPPQLAVFADGDGMTAIARAGGDLAAFDYLDHQTAAAPYQSGARASVLVLGAGGGDGVRLARRHGARKITAVEINAQMVALVRRDFAGFAGDVFAAPDVVVEIAEARSFVARSSTRYDLIHMALTGSSSASVAGLQALDQGTLFTVEAFRSYLDHLAEGGVLSITQWLRLPPRGSLKLAATAIRVMREAGIADAAARLALIRSWDTATLMVKNGAFSARELAALRDFAATRGFDLGYLPGMARREANRRNRMARAYVFDGVTALLGPDAEAFLRGYKFDLAPATDDRPYFFNFFKWGLLGELVALRSTGGLSLLEWGYLILVAAVAQAVLAGALLILLPLIALGGAGARRGMLPVFLYFAALGLAFLFIEIAFIERFTLFLGHPLYAVVVVLAAFLVFAGLGSSLSARWSARFGTRSISLALAGAALLAAAYAAALPPLFESFVAAHQAAKVVLSVALVAPLACFMGMPFPLGLRRLSAAAPELVPWAWGINGCASVVSAVLAALLAVEFGFTVVVVAALALYGLAAAAAEAARRRADPLPAA